MNLNSDTWCDLVFEGKNKEYGAYYLRKTSSKRHLYALIIVISIVCVLILSFYVWETLKKFDNEGFTDIMPINISELSTIELEYIHLENVEIHKPEETVKNTPPKIVSDEEEIPELVEQEEIAGIPADSLELNAADSLMLAEHKLKIAEMINEELITYTLNPAGSDPKTSSLQTTILRHVYHNLRYPDVAYKQRIKGKVVYSFIVNKDGSISDITLEKGVYIFLDEEVLRVIQSLPTLEPEMRDNKPIRVKFYLPVVFS